MNESRAKSRRVLGLPYPAGHRLAVGWITERAGYLVRRPRGSGDWLMMLTLSGAGRVAGRGGDVACQAGSVVLLPQGWPHDYGIAAGATEWELLYAHFHTRPHWLGWLDWPEGEGGAGVVNASRKAEGDAARHPLNGEGVGLLLLGDKQAGQDVRAAFFEAHRLATSALPDARALALNAFEKMLILTRAVNPKADRPVLDERVQAAIEYLGRHITESVTVAAVARAVHLSPSRLAHLFHEQTSLTVMGFLERHRLERAKQLLETTPHTVAAVGRQVGFADAFYFSKRFKAYTGRSPRAFRGGL